MRVKSKEKPCDTSNSTQSWNELKTILGKFYWNNLFNSFNVLFCIGGGGEWGGSLFESAYWMYIDWISKTCIIKIERAESNLEFDFSISTFNSWIQSRNVLIRKKSDFLPRYFQTAKGPLVVSTELMNIQNQEKFVWAKEHVYYKRACLL